MDHNPSKRKTELLFCPLLKNKRHYGVGTVRESLAIFISTRHLD